MKSQSTQAQEQRYKFIKFRDLIIYYNNEESAKQTLEEVFNDRPYLFKSNKSNPLIIDAGSNIGITTLFFKVCYPAARIICFEPDPNAFNLLKLNIESNRLKDITLVNAALSNKDGVTDFYGQIYVDNPDARGNSIFDIWGAQRTIYNKIQVKSVKLSSYINSTVDLLKLDIEGAEEQVLTELGDKIKIIENLAIEFHGAKRLKSINSINRIKLLLQKYGFNYEITANNTSILPEAVKDWAKKINPKLYTIKAEQNLQT